MEETKASGGQDGEQAEGEGGGGRRKKGLVFLEGELELKEISREGCFCVPRLRMPALIAIDFCRQSRMQKLGL